MKYKIVIEGRHRFFETVPADAEKFVKKASPNWVIVPDDDYGVPIRLTASQREALYYVSISDTAEVPVLKKFAQALGGMKGKGLIEKTANGWVTTELGKQVIDVLRKDPDIFPQD